MLVKKYVSGCDECKKEDHSGKREGWYIYVISAVSGGICLTDITRNQPDSNSNMSFSPIFSREFCSRECRDKWVEGLVSSIRETFNYRVNDIITGVKTPDFIELIVVCE